MELQTVVGYNPSTMQIKLNVPIDLQPMPDIDLASFCRETRELLGLSKSQMADWLSLEYATYDNYEHGRRPPTSQVIAKLFLVREQLIKALPQLSILTHQQSSAVEK